MPLSPLPGESREDHDRRNREWMGDQYPTTFPVPAVLPRLELLSAPLVDEVEEDEPLGPENLPESFWWERPVLRHVLSAAQSRLVSPDAVLGAVLARLSSYLPPQVHVGTGLRPASLNVFAALIGTSSAGKTLANNTASDLLPVPAQLATNYLDDQPIGSGEGLAEAFYGMQSVVVPNANGNGSKTLRQRAIVRENAMLYVDEGEMLSKMMERSGATIGQVLRTAWVGGTLGQSNASADRTRRVPGGTYSLGLVIGYQRTTVQPMLSDGGGGTPQRFLFFSAHAEPAEDEVPWPGPLAVRLPSSDLLLPRSAREELRAARRAAQRPDATDEGLDGHRPLHLAKVSALLAVLDGRDTVSIADWGLAWIVWKTSCAVRDRLVREAETDRRLKAKAKTDDAVRTTVQTHRALETEEDRKILRVARLIADKTHERCAASGGEPWPIGDRGGVSATLASRDRRFMEDGITEAVARGWVFRVAAGLLPGESRPG
jgi:hypothetical protein